MQHKVSGLGIPGQDGGSHEDERLGLRDPANVGVALAASSWLGAAAEAQEVRERKVQRKERSWKLTVVSEAVPGKIRKKLTVRIEGDTFVCRSSDVPLLEIPLKTVMEISRDDDKDYAVSRWLMKCGRATL